jgi:hypothetical protein
MGSKAIYPAMFLVSGSTLVFQLIVTRILSVTLLYHFSLMVISLSMLGLTGGAIFAYRCERWLSKYTLESQLGVSALRAFLCFRRYASNDFNFSDMSFHRHSAFM